MSFFTRSLQPIALEGPLAEQIGPARAAYQKLNRDIGRLRDRAETAALRGDQDAIRSLQQRVMQMRREFIEQYVIPLQALR